VKEELKGSHKKDPSVEDTLFKLVRFKKSNAKKARSLAKPSNVVIYDTPSRNNCTWLRFDYLCQRIRVEFKEYGSILVCAQYASSKKYDDISTPNIIDLVGKLLGHTNESFCRFEWPVYEFVQKKKVDTPTVDQVLKKLETPPLCNMPYAGLIKDLPTPTEIKLFRYQWSDYYLRNWISVKYKGF